MQVLFITIRLAIPSVLRFATCVFVLFAAFSLCGWLILGPYHPKVITITGYIKMYVSKPISSICSLMILHCRWKVYSAF